MGKVEMLHHNQILFTLVTKGGLPQCSFFASFFQKTLNKLQFLHIRL